VDGDATIASLTGVPPFEAPLHVLHVLGSSGRVTVAHHLEAQRAGGWQVSSHVLGRLSGPGAVSRAVARMDPDVVVLHGVMAGVVGRLAVRGERTTVLQLRAWSWRRVPRALRAPIVLWERWAGRWVNLVLLDDPAEAADGVHRKVWVPPFAVAGSVNQTAAVLCRAHVFGQAAGRQGMPKGSRPGEPLTRLVPAGTGASTAAPRSRHVTRVDEELP
jgi:hypothetical protein